MLTENIWTEVGLVNGAQGTLYDILWAEGVVDPRTTTPLYLLVDFPGYKGPPLPNANGTLPYTVVPVFISRRIALPKNAVGDTNEEY